MLEDLRIQREKHPRVFVLFAIGTGMSSSLAALSLLREALRVLVDEAQDVELSELVDEAQNVKLPDAPAPGHRAA